jgi:hypothetical protein
MPSRPVRLTIAHHMPSHSSHRPRGVPSVLVILALALGAWGFFIGLALWVEAAT